MSKFIYEKEGELRVGSCFCEFCVHFNPENPKVCKWYPDGIEQDVLANERICDHREKKKRVEL